MPALRFKVGIVYAEFKSVTVWAETAKEAAEKAMGGDGAPAETWGPLPAAIAAAEMGTPEAAEMHLDSKYWLVPAGVLHEEERSPEGTV